jgi:hypothetical protein
MFKETIAVYTQKHTNRYYFVGKTQNQIAREAGTYSYHGGLKD